MTISCQTDCNMALRIQTPFFVQPQLNLGLQPVVNVSKVPQLSPFRYPGGKTWLVPTVREWLSSMPKPRLLIEPFAGGGIIGLTAAFEGLADRVLLVELDEEVSAVWQTILSREAKWLASTIVNFECTYDNVVRALETPVKSTRQRAFVTILKNRTYHGGILAAGSGLMKHGENGKGISSRWYPETLSRRILAIHGHRERIVFECGDGLDVIKRHADQVRTAFFIDPPYTAAGKKAGRRLYGHNVLDHDELFRRVSRVQGRTMFTYDDAEGVRQLAAKYGFDVGEVAMQNTHLRRMVELIISKDLGWHHFPESPVST